MNAAQHRALGELLAAWNRHEDARHADIRHLAEARFSLDSARAHMRSTISPMR